MCVHYLEYMFIPVYSMSTKHSISNHVYTMFDPFAFL